MADDLDLRCAPDDIAGLLEEIKRRDKIIEALISRVQRSLDSPQNEFSLLQATFILEEEVSRRTTELETALSALTEAKREAEAVRQRLAAAIGAISEGFALFNPQDELVLCNDAYRTLWGFGPDVIGRTYTDLATEVTHRYKPADPNWLARYVRDHQSGTGTSEYRVGDGRILQVRERKTADGATVGLYADITELAKLKAAEAARRQLLEIIDFLPDGTFAVDENRLVIAWNRAMEVMTGVAKEDIIGKGDDAVAVAVYGERRPTLLHLIGSENSDVLSKYENVRRKGNSIYAEVFVPSAFAGRGAFLDLMASPLLDREGRQVGAIESLRDVTDRKRAESELQAMQEQLRQAAKMEAIGRLAGGIAHDFNNQLTIVQGYTKLLMDRFRDATVDCSRELQEILRAAERSAQLTSQLLAFGRKQVLHSEVLDLAAVLTQLRDPLGRLIGEDIKVQLEIAPDLWKVKTDRNQLEQAIINLTINARDAMPGGGQLTIAARNTFLNADYVLHHMGANEGEHVCLTIRDTGVGMDDHTLARVFEPFFTTKPVGVGTGLGLAIVYGFVKQSDGYLEVHSEEGRGSCFSLYFPRAIDASIAEEVPAAETPTSGTETILIVEDQEALRELTAHILESSGYQVLQACDGERAIALNRQFTSAIDLVLCDVVMPNLYGPDVVKQLLVDRPTLKVIYVTGYAERTVLQPNETRMHVLSKPFTPETLFRVVRQVLDEDVTTCA